MTNPPIILVPGFWLGAWAWDEVAPALRAGGFDVTALTLPGMGSLDDDRSGIGLQDHVDAIVGAVRAAGPPAVLAVHSGTGFAGYAATDAIPDQLAAMIYVDSGPGKGPMDADQAGDLAFPGLEKLAEDENLEGIGQERLDEFARRAVPVPGGVVRDAIDLTNDARLDVPSTMICTAFSAKEYQDAAKEGYAFLAGLDEIRTLTFVELPTSHWPMWSKPKELTEIIAGIASAAS
ncbi:MAG TPA: alpha/beta hydrolase [Actinomycetota bacterium]|nr:alpha/beta hydrolase [Actinomycetota bacterium]